MNKIIVIADSFEAYKKWCIDNKINRWATNCEHRFMINDYSVRGILVKEVIDITTTKTKDNLRLKSIAIWRKATQEELLIDTY